MAEETSHSGWEFEGVTEEDQGRGTGGLWLWWEGTAHLPLRLSYLCSSPELTHGCPELLDKRPLGSESLTEQLVQVSLAVTGGARMMVPKFLKSLSSALLLSPVLGTEYAKERKKYQTQRDNYHFP